MQYTHMHVCENKNFQLLAHVLTPPPQPATLLSICDNHPGLSTCISPVWCKTA